MNFRGMVLSITLLIPTLSSGQIKITADTIHNDCLYAIKIKTDKLIIDSQEKYNSEFVYSGNQACAPFDQIDFEKSILVFFEYPGSNCSRKIQWSAIEEKGNGYLIQFATNSNHMCRDLSFQIAWFVVDKPDRKVEITVEHVRGEQNSR